MIKFIALLIICFPLLCVAQPSLPLGKGVLKIDMTKVPSINFYTDESCSEILHNISLKSNNVGVVELKENNSDAKWFQPEQFFPSYDIFLIRVDSMASDKLRIFINSNGKTSWIKMIDGFQFINWRDFLMKQISAVQKNEWDKIAIKTEPTVNSALIKIIESTDCFKVLEIKDNWMKIRTDTKSGCSETTRPVKSGWVQWNKDNRLRLSYSLLL